MQSNDGKYGFDNNQVAITEIGKICISTIWVKENSPVDHFETIIFGMDHYSEQNPIRYSSETESLQSHACIVAGVIGGMTEPV